jgi:hypothetical protein
MTYLIATIILYILTYAFLLRLGCCPTCCDKEALVEVEEEELNMPLEEEA